MLRNLSNPLSFEIFFSKTILLVPNNSSINPFVFNSRIENSVLKLNCGSLLFITISSLQVVSFLIIQEEHWNILSSNKMMLSSEIRSVYCRSQDIVAPGYCSVSVNYMFLMGNNYIHIYEI